jgi:hypothetical protein
MDITQRIKRRKAKLIGHILRRNYVLKHIAEGKRGERIMYMYIYIYVCLYTGRFIMFSVITNIYNKKTKGPTLIELFKVTGKLKKVFFDN